MDTIPNAILLIGGSMAASVSGLLFVRRYANINWLKQHHEVASYFFLMVGTLYSVLVAFAIFVVWSGFKDADSNLQHEATEVADLSRLSVNMPDPVRRAVSNALMGISTRSLRMNSLLWRRAATVSEHGTRYRSCGKRIPPATSIPPRIRLILPNR